MLAGWLGMDLLQRLRERFWFVPALLCGAALLLAEVLVVVDQRLGDLELPGWASVAFYRVGESGSRDILGAIASSSLAVAGTTFSITMAVLALTSSSYGPRLVRNFMADRGNQAVLGVFVATFLYSLMVLRSIRVLGDPGNPDAEVFVPHLATNIAVLLAVADVAVLIYFIHHISDSIQVATLAGRVRTELRETVDRMYPAALGADEPRRSGRDGAGLPADLDRTGVEVTAGRAGYLQYLDEDELMATATAHDVVLALRVRPGQYLLDSTVAVVAHPAERVGEEVRAAVRGALGVADARSPHQDVEFAVQQLTEMAVRALSPGTNDPYTAINALDDLSVGLTLLAGRDLPSSERYDDEGVLRVHAPRPEAGALVGQVVDAMRWYAAGHPSVMHKTLEVLERTGRSARSDVVRRGLVVHVDLLVDAFRSAGHHSHDVRSFEGRAEQVRAELAGSV